MEKLGAVEQLTLFLTERRISGYYVHRALNGIYGNPHEVVLRTLLSDRDERRSRGLDGRLVSMNDQTILAVADVVRRCAEFGAPLPGPAPGEIADLDDDGEI